MELPQRKRGLQRVKLSYQVWYTLPFQQQSLLLDSHFENQDNLTLQSFSLPTVEIQE